MQSLPLTVVILAAGKGKRMYSDLPKVCHYLGGKPMLQHVLSTARALSPNKIIIVYGHGAEEVVSLDNGEDVKWVEQEEQLGTGHAVAQALPYFVEQERVLVLFGDVPLVRQADLKKLISETPDDGVGLITAKLDEPFGLGRIKRKQADIVAIVEEKDASLEEKSINEIFSGIMCLPTDLFSKWWPTLENNNAQKEFYLTDMVACAVNDGKIVKAVTVNEPSSVLGVNSREQLAKTERQYQKQLVKQLMDKGVSFYDPKRVDIRGDIEIGKDTIVDINVILEGKVCIGERCYIGANSYIKNSVLASNVTIKPSSQIDGAQIAESCQIGPFARIRPGTVLENGAQVGNFVEIKKSIIGEKTKASHLSYIGDAIIGKYVNIGAGVITVNYDGVNKHQTIIEDGAFIGCDTQLIAPVTVHYEAFIGAGSTITKDTPASTLVLSRSEQKIIKGWNRPQKKP